MANNPGARSRLAHVLEATFGTTPTIASNLFDIPHQPHSLKGARDELLFEDLPTDHNRQGLALGRRTAGGDIPVQLRSRAHANLLALSLLYSASAARARSTAGTDTAAEGTANSFTRSEGSFVTNNFVAGQRVRVTGFSNAANNGVKTVATVSAKVLTFDDTDIVDEVAGQNVKIEGTHVHNGTTLGSMTLEAGYLGLTLYELYTGVRVTGCALEIPNNALATATFNTMAKDFQAISGTPLGSPAAFDTGGPVYGFDSANSDVQEGGSSSAIVQNASVAWTWNATRLPVLGAITDIGIEPGFVDVTGSLTAWFQSAALFNKFRNETASSLLFQLANATGDRIYVDLPAVKYTDGDHPVPADAAMGVTLPFRAYEGSDGWSIAIDMVPATATAP